MTKRSLQRKINKLASAWRKAQGDVISAEERLAEVDSKSFSARILKSSLLIARNELKRCEKDLNAAKKLLATILEQEVKTKAFAERESIRALSEIAMIEKKSEVKQNQMERKLLSAIEIKTVNSASLTQDTWGNEAILEAIGASGAPAPLSENARSENNSQMGEVDLLEMLSVKEEETEEETEGENEAI